MAIAKKSLRCSIFNLLLTVRLFRNLENYVEVNTLKIHQMK